MKNQVIKVLTPEHGKEVIKYWQEQGVDVRGFTGACTVDNHPSCYYGVINGLFDIYTLPQVDFANSEIIELPGKLPKRGDKVLVWNDSEDGVLERIFIAYIEGATNPVIAVDGVSIDKFNNGDVFRLTTWQHYKLIEPNPEEEVHLTFKEISEGKGVGVPPHLIRIKDI